MTNYEPHDVVGNAGVLCVLAAFFLLQTGRLRPEHATYSLLNGLGALLLLGSLAVDFNLSAFVLQVAWLAISGIGLGRALRRRKPE